MTISYTFLQIFILGGAFIILLIETNILLIYTNFVSKQPHPGLKNESLFNHINISNEYLS